MSGEAAPLTGPDLAQGVPSSDLPDGGMLLGHAHGEPVLLVRQGEEFWAIGARCTHYGGPLAEGLAFGGQVRCPLHHACFDLRTGRAVRAPALDPVPCWEVERRGALIAVGQRRPAPVPTRTRPASLERVVIVGAGAAGNAAAETLRWEGYTGPLTVIGADLDRPVDRPNLSKDFLAGTAPVDWVPLRGPDFYAAHGIELVLGVPAVAIEPGPRRVLLADGTSRSYGALLLATGASPNQLAVPGGEAVRYLRSFADSRAIIERARAGAAAVVVGASFIGLEVAASLRARGLEVAVVAHEARPFERVLGAELGDFIRGMHEAHGVRFHLRHTVRSVEERTVVLDDGTRLAADLVVAGVGVRPELELAEKAGLRTDRGVLVDAYLETSAPGIYAAGDVARWPDPHSGEPIRIEHWVVAERQGQTAARNILGAREPFRAVPFFWSQHYDVTISYVGHADRWERAEIKGSIVAKDCLVAFRSGRRIAAVATIGRDLQSLRAELLLERDDQAGLEALLG
jgi:NADPH-dependent 2,4-dienoyl-CoA reductase/sulfur reductase-like enzyme/nitrite reductase/ring-hydroxylating ferredoxin subunit